jgi:tripartite-type tricarboxylate transporter receptor subunit TctC
MKRIALLLRRPLRMLALALAAVSSAALGQTWPAKSIRLVVPYAAGGATDAYARVFGPKFVEAWGQQVVVENRPGAGGNIGSAIVAKAPPDGYTILLNTSGQAIAPALYRKLPYDAARDLQPVVMLVRGVQVLMVSPGIPANSVKELIALAKAQPGKINFGSNGVGSGPHLAGELFRALAGVDIVHIPYKGDVALTPALLAGEVQMAFLPAVAAAPLVRSGKLRPLGVASATRTSFMPDVPTVAESGVPNYDLSTWAGLFVPAGTPREVVQKISAEGVRLVKSPELQKIMVNWGVEGLGIGVEGFEERYRADIEKYVRLIREAGIPQQD